MLYNFLVNSITDKAKLKVSANPALYYIGDRKSGQCLLKVIIGKSTVDTIGTFNTIRGLVSNLPGKISALDSNIKEVNDYVEHIKVSFEARGEQVPELHHHLFRAYVSVDNEAFKQYIGLKQFACEDGEAITVETLIASDMNKYELMNENEEWGGGSFGQGSKDHSLRIRSEEVVKERQHNLQEKEETEQAT